MNKYPNPSSLTNIELARKFALLQFKDSWNNIERNYVEQLRNELDFRELRVTDYSTMELFGVK